MTMKNNPLLMVDPRFFIALMLLLALGAANLLNPVQAEILVIGGTGSSAPLVEQFTQAYKSLKPEITVRVISPPMGSNASIRAILAGVIDLAVPGKPLTEEQKAQGGQDWPLGRTPFLLVTSREQEYAGFTVEQLAAIYSGKMTAWADGSPIRLVLRSPMESDTLILRKLSPLMDQAIDAALARPGMLMAANDLENIALLEKTPNSIGTTNLGLIQGQERKLRILPLNGAPPTLAAMTQGDYPYFKTLYIARGPTLSPEAQGFLEFMLSASGREILDRTGYAPVPPQQ